MTGSLRAEAAPPGTAPAGAGGADAQLVQVLDGEQVVATVVTSRRRQRSDVDRAGWGADAASSRGARDPRPTGADERAWPQASADAAARARWRDLHPTLATVSSVSVAPTASPELAAVLEAAGAFLADRGVRRLDLRLARDHPAVALLHGPGWVVGALGSDVIASLPVRYPWSLADVVRAGPSAADRLPRWLPGRARRLTRRLLAVHPRRLPEVGRTALAEIGGAARHRHLTRRARSTRSEQAPDEAHPFGATRYRTIHTSLAQVPPALRTTTFLDVGSGDGRVLVEASSLGFRQVLGREVDPGLVETSAAALGARGRVEAGDALATPIPADVGVVFLNNPFAAPAVGRLAQMVAASLEADPRPLLVVYLNPRTIEPFLACGLVLVDAAPQFTLLASSRAEPG